MSLPICAYSLAPSLLAHMKYGSKWKYSFILTGKLGMYISKINFLHMW